MQNNGYTSRRSWLKICLLAGASMAMPGCGRSRASEKSLIIQLPWVKDAEFIGYFTAESEKVAALLGRKKTFYQEENLNVVLIPGGPDTVPEVTLLKGDADVALTSPDNTLTYIVNEQAPLLLFGAQYFKSPLGVVSLAGSGIKTPRDLVGKRLAVPSVNIPSVHALLAANNIDAKKVQIRPYQYDPMILIDGVVDATLDFITNVPYVVKQKTGKDPETFLLADHGFYTVMDTLTAKTEFLQSGNPKRELIVKWLRASTKAWDAVRSDGEKGGRGVIPDLIFNPSVLDETKRSLEAEKAFNAAQLPFIFDLAPDSKRKALQLADEDIRKTIDSLNRIGIRAATSHFDRSVFASV